jgi:hypothetical protein
MRQRGRGNSRRAYLVRVYPGLTLWQRIGVALFFLLMVGTTLLEMLQ